MFGIDLDVEKDNFWFVDSFHRSVAKNMRYKADVLYTLADGYELHRVIDAKYKIHEQVGCLVTLASLLNKYQNRNINIDTLFQRERSLFENSDLVLCPSNVVVKYVKDIYPDAITKLVEYPVPDSFNCNIMDNTYTDLSFSGHILNVVFVGRMEELKGSSVILKLANKHRNIKFHLVGNCVIDIAHFKNIKSYGFVSREFLLNSILLNMDIFLFPSLCEGSALAAQEAMSRGLPGVVSSQSGTHYIDGETGFILDAYDFEGFSNKLDLISKNPELLKKLKDNVKNPAINPMSKYGNKNYQEKIYHAITELTHIGDY
jgi:glycosyltransferase involved in cell wall biosynthesis